MAACLSAISRSRAESISLMSTLKYRPRNATMKMAAWKIEALCLIAAADRTGARGAGALFIETLFYLYEIRRRSISHSYGIVGTFTGR
jgi:hypothetical protein